MAHYDLQNLSPFNQAAMASVDRPPPQVMAQPAPTPFVDHGVFSVERGLFMPEGSSQQLQAAKEGKAAGLPYWWDGAPSALTAKGGTQPSPPPMDSSQQPVGGMPSLTAARRRQSTTLNLVDTPLTTQLSLGMPMPSPSKSLLDQ